MLAHMKDRALEVILKLFNKIWNTTEFPVQSKQSVIVPRFKESSSPASYRLIPLTSQLGKTKEHIVTE